MERKQMEKDKNRAAVKNLIKKANAKKVVSHSIDKPTTKDYVTTCKKNERKLMRESACYANAYLSAADYYVE